MQVKFETEQPYLLKKGIREGYLTPIGGGAFTFISGVGINAFKQNLKKSEAEKMLAASKVINKEEPKKEKEPDKENTEDAEPFDEEKRTKELSEMSLKDLRIIAEETYEGIGKGVKKAELIKLIIEAESEEE